MPALQAYGSMSFTNQADIEGLHHIFQDDDDGDSFTYIRVRGDKDKPVLTSDHLAQQVAKMISVLSVREDKHKLQVMSGSMMQLTYSPRSLILEQEVHLSSKGGTKWSTKIEDTDEQWHVLRDIAAQHAAGVQERGRFVPIEDSHVVRDEKSTAISDDLEIYHYDHTAMGTRYGSERAVMHPMVQSFIENTKGEIDSIRKHLIDRECLNEEETAPSRSVDSWSCNDHLMFDQLRYLEKVLEQAQEYQASGKKSMIDSNYYRDLLQNALEARAFDLGSILIQETQKEALKKKATIKGNLDPKLYDELFRKEAIELGKKIFTKEDWDAIQEEAADHFIPFLSNCWRQTARSSLPDGTVGQEMSWMRFGAFYDSRNILFSLDELLDPVEGMGTKEEMKEKVRLIVDNLLDMKHEIDSSNKPPKNSQEYFSTMAAIDYALNKLAVKDQHSEHWTVDLPSAMKWAAERRSIAQTQFLSLLESQVGKLKPGDTRLDWAHLSLLKPNEQKIEKMGWTHSEKNELSDMKWAFDHFRGAQITFSDEPGLPKIEYDENGKPTTITLSRRHIQGRQLSDQPIELNSHLLSCSVASKGVSSDGVYNDDAKGVQQRVNQSFFDEIVDAPEDEGGFNGKYKEITTDEQRKRMESLRSGQSSFYAAEDLGLELLQRGWSLSVNCQSGKDRTGYVCSRIAQRVVLGGLEKAREAGRVTGVSYHLKRYLLDLRPFETGRVTQQVLRANTGANYVKVGVANLPGTDPLYLRRIGHYAGLVFESIRGTHKPVDV